MHISFASILTVAAFVGVASACNDKSHHHGGKHHKGGKHHHGGKPHHGVAKGKAFDHILQIWFENQVSTYSFKGVDNLYLTTKIIVSTKDFDVVSKVPGFTNLLKKGILLDNFNAITHPSEPNYVAAGGGSTFGITNDDYYNIPASIKTIYDLLENKGLTWKVRAFYLSSKQVKILDE